MADQPNWDPEVKNFFVKILNSIALGLAWMMACATAGLYFELGYSNGKPVIYTILFYTIATITLGLLIWYLYKKWK
jgi:hypothetical protein